MLGRLLAADHADVLTAKNRRAAILWSLGKPEEAIPLFEEIVAARGSRLGRRAFDTIAVIGNLGANDVSAGRVALGLPLLEEVHGESANHPRLRGPVVQLIEAHARVGPSRPDASAKGLALLDEVVGGFAGSVDPKDPATRANAVDLVGHLAPAARSLLPASSPEPAQRLARFGLVLLALGACEESEPILRETLTIREEIAPDDWRTFNVRSVLGGALLGQRKLEEAETLLPSGHRGMMERAASIPPQGRARVLEVLERLVRLYEVEGDDDRAAEWRKALDAARGP